MSKDIGGLPHPKKILGTKNMLNLIHPTLSANIYGMDIEIQHRKTRSLTAFLLAFGEKSSVNFGPLITET